MNQDLISQGYVHIYTGNSKGKTTAALGLAFRAAGRELRTYIGQFMKGQSYGELNTAKMLDSYLTIEQYGKDSFIHVKNPPDPEDVKMAKNGLIRAKKAMLSGEYDLVVFDEINVAHFFNLVSVAEMLDIIKAKPKGVELVFTGRYAPREIIAAADLVTEMREIKHYYTTGVIARRGYRHPRWSACPACPAHPRTRR